MDGDDVGVHDGFSLGPAAAGGGKDLKLGKWVEKQKKLRKPYGESMSLCPARVVAR